MHSPFTKPPVPVRLALAVALLLPSAWAAAGNFLMNDEGNGAASNNAKAAALGHTVTEANLYPIVSMSVDELLEYDVVWANPGSPPYQTLRTGVYDGGTLEQYAFNGGTLVLCVAGLSNQPDIAPGGVDMFYGEHDSETFVTPTNPYLTGYRYAGTALSSSHFLNWSPTDYGWLANLPAGATTVLSNSDGPSFVEYDWGCGHVIVTTLAVGWSFNGSARGAPQDNLINYADSLFPTPLTSSDNFGYTFYCTPRHFRDISATGTPLTLTDDQVYGPIAMPFNFTFYGIDIPEFYIAANGFLKFAASASTGCCNGGPIPDPASPNFIVAGYWDDLYPPAGGTVCYQVFGEKPNRELVVGFYDVHNYQTGPTVRFEMILHEHTDNIELQYDVAQGDTSFTTVGIENADGTDGIEFFRQSNLNLIFESYLIKHPCQFDLRGDVNHDCVHNLIDFALSSATWLTDCLSYPVDPACDPF